jgi:hypothetical protein
MPKAERPTAQMTVVEAARILGRSTSRIYDLAASGVLEVVAEKPIRVSALSVHRVRSECSRRNRPPRLRLVIDNS